MRITLNRCKINGYYRSEDKSVAPLYTLAMRFPVHFPLLLVLLCRTVAAQTLNPAEEAPATLFDLSPGDADVDLYSAGSWTMGVREGLGFAYYLSTGSVSLENFPWIASDWSRTSPPFYIEPDITLSLWLMKRFFFETSILNNFEFNSILFGYQGGKNEFLKSVLIGNTAVEMGSYALLDSTAMPDKSLGVKVLFESDASRHEIMVRFEPAERMTKSFFGSNEVIEERIELFKYREGSLFIFPDSNVEDMEILLESKDVVLTGSDGRRYRLMDSNEAVVSYENGFLLFKNPPPGRVLVRYTVSGRSIGDPELGRQSLCGVSAGLLDPESTNEDFSWDAPPYLGLPWSDSRVTLNGNDYLAIYTPGAFNPFEGHNIYAPSATIPEEMHNMSLSLVHKGADKSRYGAGGNGNLNGFGIAVPFTVLPGTSLLQLLPFDDGQRNPKNRYPFAEAYPSLYGPGKKPADVYADEYLNLYVLYPVDSYILQPGVLPGSVSVLYNGKQEDRFTIDYDTGTIEFYFGVNSGDRIDVAYGIGPGAATEASVYPSDGSQAAGQGSTESDTGVLGISGKGRLTASMGNLFHLGNNLTLEAGTSLGWNINQGGYAFTDKADDGTFLLSAGIRVETDRVKAGIAGAAALSSKNTTGFLRLISMDDAGFDVPISRDLGFPSPAPALPADESGTIILEPGNRGYLYYKDYFSYGVLGAASIMPYSWSPPMDQVFDIASGNPTGPYSAGTGGEIPGAEVTVMDYYIPASKNWVGAGLPLPISDGSADLSLVSSVNFYLRAPNYQDNMKLYLHIGSIGEDLDGDGVLDEETSAYGNGFTFNDAVTGAGYLVGAGSGNNGNGILDSEDINGNGFLDVEQPSKIVVKEIALENGDWTNVSVPLSAGDAEKLTYVNSLRFILVTDGEEAAGKILLGDISFTSSGFRPLEPSPGYLQAGQVPENEMTSPASSPLTEAFPREMQTFLGTNPSAAVYGRQKVLELKWSDADAVTGAGLLKYLSPVPLNTYRNFVFFYRTPDLSEPDSAVIDVSITGRDGKGLNVSFNPGLRESWGKVVVDLKKEELTIDGTVLPDATVSYGATEGSLSIFSIRVRGSSSGMIDLDEFHLEQADVTVSGGLKGDFTYENPDFLVTAGPLTLLRTIKIYQGLELFSSGYPYPAASDKPAAGFSSTTDLETILLYSGLGITIEPQWDGSGWYLSGGHRLTLPSADTGSPVTLTDTYSERNNGAGHSFSHKNALRAAVPGIVNTLFSSETGYAEPYLSQAWKGEVSSAWTFPANLSAAAGFGIVSADYAHTPGTYFDTWVTGFRFWAPRLSDIAAERRFTGTFKTGFDASFAGLSLGADIGSLVSGTEERIQKNTLKLKAVIPVRIPLSGGDSLGLEAAYNRCLTHGLTAPFSGLFDEDFALLGETILTQEYIFTATPFGELFSRSLPDTFSGQTLGYPYVIYEPSFDLTLRRSYGSRIPDLVLPSSWKLGIKRVFSREEDTVDTETTVSASVLAAALNLFGKLGAYSLTGIYDSDEFNWSAGIDITMDQAGTVSDVNFYLRHYLAFLKEPGGVFIVENNFEKTWIDNPDFSEQVSLGFAWRKPSSIRFKPDYLKDRGNPYFKNNERISVTFSPKDNSSTGSSSSNLGAGVYLSHETSLVIDDTGYAKAFIDLGLDSSRDQVLLFGVQGGFEVSLQF